MFMRNSQSRNDCEIIPQSAHVGSNLAIFERRIRDFADVIHAASQQLAID
jgi:glycine cleavage system protein P-like pyridoxal-binding family